MGKGRLYTPLQDDIGSILKCEVVSIDSASPFAEHGKTFSMSTARVRPTPSPPKRTLAPISPAPYTPQSANRFTALTYNLLADLYATVGLISFSQTLALVSPHAGAETPANRVIPRSVDNAWAPWLYHNANNGFRLLISTLLRPFMRHSCCSCGSCNSVLHGMWIECASGRRWMQQVGHGRSDDIYVGVEVQAEQFSYCQPWMLAWGYRKQNLIAELVSYNADIMCLQVCYISAPYSKPMPMVHSLPGETQLSVAGQQGLPHCFACALGG